VFGGEDFGIEIDEDDKLKILMVFPFALSNLHPINRNLRISLVLRNLLLLDELSQDFLTPVGLQLGLRIVWH
jgi:hypothetical protein